jgi:hypothetical protein
MVIPKLLITCVMFGQYLYYSLLITPNSIICLHSQNLNEGPPPRRGGGWVRRKFFSSCQKSSSGPRKLKPWRYIRSVQGFRTIDCPNTSEGIRPVRPRTDSGRATLESESVLVGSVVFFFFAGPLGWMPGASSPSLREGRTPSGP